MSPTKQVHKIKAHQNLTSIRDPLKRFHVLGNMVADLSAAKACDSLFPTVVDQLNEFFLDQKQQRERVFSYYKLSVDLQLARAKVASNDDFTDNSPRDIKTLLSNWNFSNVWMQPCEQNDDEVCFCSWGYQWAVAALEWIRTAQWPEPWPFDMEQHTKGLDDRGKARHSKRHKG